MPYNQQGVRSIYGKPNFRYYYKYTKGLFDENEEALKQRIERAARLWNPYGYGDKRPVPDEFEYEKPLKKFKFELPGRFELFPNHYERNRYKPGFKKVGKFTPFSGGNSLNPSSGKKPRYFAHGRIKLC